MTDSFDHVLTIASAGVAVASACFAGWSAFSARKVLQLDRGRRHDELTPRISAVLERDGRPLGEVSTIHVYFEACEPLETVDARSAYGSDITLQNAHYRRSRLPVLSRPLVAGDSLRWEATFNKGRSSSTGKHNPVATLRVTCRSVRDQWVVPVRIQLDETLDSES